MAQKDRSHTCCLQTTPLFSARIQKTKWHILSWILAWFEALSRLRINLDKSSLLPVDRVENKENLALEFGCKICSLPAKYFGLPLGAKHNAVSVWDGVEERF